jgi:hypothetical protein
MSGAEEQAFSIHRDVAPCRFVRRASASARIFRLRAWPWCRRRSSAMRYEVDGAATRLPSEPDRDQPADDALTAGPALLGRLLLLSLGVTRPVGLLRTRKGQAHPGPAAMVSAVGARAAAR